MGNEAVHWCGQGVKGNSLVRAKPKAMDLGLLGFKAQLCHFNSSTGQVNCKICLKGVSWCA